MKLRSWHVEGFGVLADWRVEDLSAGLTVFHGPNEAGKTTLLAFLRGVLFGFPDGRSNEAKYPPQRGGAHGGRVVLSFPSADSFRSADLPSSFQRPPFQSPFQSSSADGEIVVERFAGRGKKVAVTLSDGSPGTPEDLAQLLGGADARLYRSVYAFGLGELQELATLNEAGVRDHLFAAGVTGAGSSVRRSIRRLRDEEEVFVAPGRRKQDRAKALAAEIAAVQAAIDERRREAKHYPEVLERERVLERELSALRQEMELRRGEQRRAERLIELWNEVWSPLADARQQIRKLGPVDRLPADLERRFAEVRRSVKTAEQRLEAVRIERADVGTELRGLRTDDSLRAVAARVEALHEQLSLHRRDCDAAAELDQRLRDVEDRIRRVLLSLGTNQALGTNRALGSDLEESSLRLLQQTSLQSVQSRDQLRGWRERLGVARARFVEERAAQRILAEERERLAGMQQQRLRDAEAADSEAEATASEAEIERRAGALRGLRSSIASLSPQLEALRELEGRAAAAASQVRGPGPVGLFDAALALAALSSAGLALAVGLAAVGRISLGQVNLRDAMAMAAAIAASTICGAGLFAWREARHRKGAEALEAERRESGAGLDLQIADVGTCVLDLALEHAVESGSNNVAERLRSEPQQLLEELEIRFEREREAQRAAAVSARRLRDQASRGAVELAEHARRLAVAEERLRHAVRDAGGLEADFEHWKRETGLPVELSVEAAVEFLDEVRRGRDALDLRDRYAAELRQLRHGIAHWEADCFEVILEVTRELTRGGHIAAGVVPAAVGKEESVEQAPFGSLSCVDALVQLRARCREDASLRERRAPIEQRARALAEHDLRAEESLQAECSGLAALLSDAGAKDEDELRAKLSACAVLASESARVEGAESELERRLEAAGGGDEAAWLREELPRGSVSEWEQQALRANEALARADAQREDALRRHQDALNARRALEQSTVVVEQEMQRAELEQELQETVGEWRRLRLARGLLERALERFEREHQPGVLREASQLFARVTAGRYRRVVQVDDRVGFGVVDRGGSHRGPEDLSRGTQEQLYLCLRLGLVAELSRTRVPLPVVMDDVLVNFDDQRAAETAALLVEFAREHQLLFFTCTARTRDLLARAGPQVDVRVLGDSV